MLIRPRHDQTKRVVVAIPVRNEAERIATCLAALARQCSPPDDILLLLNNCTDDTLPICQAAQKTLPSIRIIERTLTGALSSAGEARRLALEFAVSMSGDGVILTTDADAVVPDNWVTENLRAIMHGAEAVCGKAIIDPQDEATLPPHLHADHMREELCITALDALDNALNPDPQDPWPRHQQRSGASIAVTAQALRRAGGPPHVAQGEDRALIEKLRYCDAAVRHADITVTVSGRLLGRATGGMAETISRRLHTADKWADERVEPAIDAYRRALAKSRLALVRKTRLGAQSLGHDLLIGIPAMQWAMREKYFGAAWAYVQRISPVLHRRQVALEDVPRQTRQAVVLLNQIAAERGESVGAQQAAD